MDYGETLYGSREMLELIYKNQNPEDCSTAQYIISSGWPFGFGSRIHMEGIGLSIGLNTGSFVCYYLQHMYALVCIDVLMFQFSKCT